MWGGECCCYLFLFVCSDRVRDSIKLSVSKVTIEQYDTLNSEPQDLRKAGKVVVNSYTSYITMSPNLILVFRKMGFI